MPVRRPMRSVYAGIDCEKPKAPNKSANCCCDYHDCSNFLPPLEETDFANAVTNVLSAIGSTRGGIPFSPAMLPTESRWHISAPRNPFTWSIVLRGIPVEQAVVDKASARFHKTQQARFPSN